MIIILSLIVSVSFISIGILTELNKIIFDYEDYENEKEENVNLVI